MKHPNNISAIRKSRGLSQSELAERCHTQNQQISHLELGKRRLTWEWMQRIASVLECHPTELVSNGPSSSLSAEEETLLEQFRMLPKPERKALSRIASEFAQAKAPAYKPPSPRKPKA